MPALATMTSSDPRHPVLEAVVGHVADLEAANTDRLSRPPHLRGSHRSTLFAASGSHPGSDSQPDRTPSLPPPSPHQHHHHCLVQLKIATDSPRLRRFAT